MDIHSFQEFISNQLEINITRQVSDPIVGVDGWGWPCSVPIPSTMDFIEWKFSLMFLSFWYSKGCSLYKLSSTTRRFPCITICSYFLHLYIYICLYRSHSIGKPPMVDRKNLAPLRVYDFSLRRYIIPHSYTLSGTWFFPSTVSPWPKHVQTMFFQEHHSSSTLQGWMAYHFHLLEQMMSLSLEDLALRPWESVGCERQRSKYSNADWFSNHVI